MWGLQFFPMNSPTTAHDEVMGRLNGPHKEQWIKASKVAWIVATTAAFRLFTMPDIDNGTQPGSNQPDVPDSTPEEPEPADMDPNSEGKSKRSTNKLAPDPDSKGDHSSYERDENGNIYKYETYEKTNTGNDNPVKRFDGGKKDGSKGAPHVNNKTGEEVPTPHVQGKKIPVRPPTEDEIPKNKRFNNGG